MKAHIGVDDASGLVHTVVCTSASVSDMSQFGELLHGDEIRISADLGYDYPQIHAQLKENLIEDWVARKAKPGKPLDAWTRNLNHAIAQLRAVGEHPFRILKRQFGYTKVRYRGLAKNTTQLVTLFALGNLYQVQRALSASG
jgi:IS5 family transposase